MKNPAEPQERFAQSDWRKLGLLYSPSGQRPWARHSFLTPTPFSLDASTCRLYGSVRDENGRGRITYIDLDASDPTQVRAVARAPVLDLGSDGAFDESGVILGDVLRTGREVRLYYVGFQRPTGAKFLAFTGLAVSEDGGESFQRFQETPIVEQAQGARFIRALHTVHPGRKWNAWGAQGDGWEVINGKPFPRYDTYRFVSDDGITWESDPKPTIPRIGSEYRLGRPRIHHDRECGHMLFTRGTVQGAYSLGYAASKDGVTWHRDDSRVPLHPSETGWDSEALCYFAIWRSGSRTYGFYNGNGMGRDGVGIAVLERQDPGGY